jgi:hypothetical protein
MIWSRQLVATALAALAALAIAAPVAGASAGTTRLPLAGVPFGGVPGAVPLDAVNCGTATSLGLDAGAGGIETKVCAGTGPVFIGPSVGQVATVIGPTIIGPAVIGATGVSAASVFIG